MKNFHSNLRRIRREKDLTQEQLAKKTGIHQTHISHFEREDRKPSFKNLVSLANALECTIDELVSNG